MLNRGRGTATVDSMPDESPSGFLRLFIAIAVPPDVRREIARAQGQLQRVAPLGVLRWTRPDQFHVTLKFLGDVPATQLDALKAAVAEVCADCPALALTAKGIGFFPGVHRPRVLWASAGDDCGRLAELHRQLHAVMQPFAPEEKPERFAGHITLGRFKPGRHASLKKLTERATMLRDCEFGAWTAGQVEIIRSELTSAGAHHTSLAACPLR